MAKTAGIVVEEEIRNTSFVLILTVGTALLASDANLSIIARTAIVSVTEPLIVGGQLELEVNKIVRVTKVTAMLWKVNQTIRIDGTSMKKNMQKNNLRYVNASHRSLLGSLTFYLLFR